MAEHGKFVGRWRPTDDGEPIDRAFPVVLTPITPPGQPTLCFRYPSDLPDDEWTSLGDTTPVQGRAERFGRCVRLEFRLTGEASDPASCGPWFLPPPKSKPPASPERGRALQ